MNILFTGAHPDDETFASGTLAKYASKGHNVTIVMASRGGMGHWKLSSNELKKIRTREMEKAADIIGAEIKFLEFQDASIPLGDELKETFVDIIREIKPDILITFHPLVWRDDHRRVGLASSDATLKASLPLHKTDFPEHRPEPEVFFYGSPMIPIESDVYIDISNFMDIKIRAFKQHKSQWMKWGSSESEHEEYFMKVKNRFIHRFRQYGLESGVKYAECFISRNRKKHVYDLPHP